MVTYWVYHPAAEMFGPSKFVGFAEMSFERYLRAVGGDRWTNISERIGTSSALQSARSSPPISTIRCGCGPF